MYAQTRSSANIARPRAAILKTNNTLRFSFFRISLDLKQYVVRCSTITSVLTHQFWLYFNGIKIYVAIERLVILFSKRFVTDFLNGNCSCKYGRHRNARRNYNQPIASQRTEANNLYDKLHSTPNPSHIYNLSVKMTPTRRRQAEPNLTQIP